MHSVASLFPIVRRLLAALAGFAFAASAWSAADMSSALVQLNGDPLSTYSKTRPAQGKKIDFDSNTVKAYRAQLAALRNDYKAWLRKNVPQAQVTGNFDIALNAVAVQLNGATLDQVSATPLVKSAQYQNLYKPNIADPDLSLINALNAWTVAGGPANAGAGVKVAIVDSGIDVSHPCFNDAGYAQVQQLGDHTLTNNKVIAARVFNNKIPGRGYTAVAAQAHGTHVSGTVACNYQTPTNVDGAAVPYSMSGVAPRALLGNYNIFPADVDSARSEDILDALEAAYADGFDIANMSLGGGSAGIQDLLTMAVDNLDVANMVVAVAAGNSGPGLFTVESPGSAARALTAGAASVGHFMANTITANGSYPGIVGDFGTVTADLTDPLVVMTGDGVNGLDKLCSATSTDLTGKIALITRGTCSFSTKVRNARNAGAVGVIIGNSTVGDPILMGQDGTADQPTTIPALAVSIEDAASIKNGGAASATLGATLAYFSTTHNDIMADFSSQGPTDVDFRVKPDVVAPGVNVLSSIPAAFCATPPCFAFFQGTSMATPHLAGSAAFLRGLHPDWSAADIRSAVVNTAVRNVLLRTPVTGDTAFFPERRVNIAGAGREDLLNAANATALLSPVSVSFGAVPSISGQTLQSSVAIRNGGTSAATWALSISGGDASVSYSVSPASVTLAPGASTTVTVTMNAARGAAPGTHQGMLEVGSAAHAALFTLIK